MTTLLKEAAGVNFPAAVAHYKVQVERVNVAFARACEGIRREIEESGSKRVTTSQRFRPDNPHAFYLSYETSPDTWVGSVTDVCQHSERGDRCWDLEQMWRFECIELQYAEKALARLVLKYNPAAESITANEPRAVAAVVVAVVDAHLASRT